MREDAKHQSSIVNRQLSTAWRTNFKVSSSWLAGITAVSLIIGLLIWQRQAPLDRWSSGRVVAAIVPLLFGLQASFLLSPDSEPALELLNTFPRRLPLVALERLSVSLLLHGTIALIASLVGVALMPAETVTTAVLHWLPPTLFIGGAILLVVQLTRQGVLGALMTLLLWAGLFFGGNAAVLRWSFLQPVHAYLQPDMVSRAAYLTNRATLLLTGLGMIAAALHLLRDEERVLGLRPRLPWTFWVRRAPAYVVGTAVFLYAASIGLWIDKQARRSEAPVCCLTPADAGLAFDSVRFTAPDGVMLDGWFVPSQNGAAVILLHGYNGHRAMVLPQAVALAEAGFGVLLYDLRGHSRSGGDLRSLGWADVQDVETAVTFLQAQPDIDPQRIGIFGFSVGGQIALRAAAQLDTLQAVAADGPGSAHIADFPPAATPQEHLTRFGTRLALAGLSMRTGVGTPTAVVEHIADIAPRPILLIATGADDATEQEMARHFYNHAAEPKTLWTIPEATHGGGMQARPEAYRDQIVAFFQAGLLE